MLGRAFWQLAFYLGHNEIDELLRNSRRQVELRRHHLGISFITAPRKTCRRSVTQIGFDRLWIVPEPKIRGNKSTSRVVRHNGTKAGWLAKIGQKVAIVGHLCTTSW